MQVTVPIEEIGPDHHCLGHIGLTEEGYSLLRAALRHMELNADAATASKYHELRRDFLLEQDVPA